MSFFDSTDSVYEVFEPYMNRIVRDPKIGPKFVSANTAFRVNFTDPEAVFLIDARQDPPVVLIGDDARNSDTEIDLEMAADDGHKFWLGELNMMLALAKGRVKVEGPKLKLIGILPALQPAFASYRAYLEESGRLVK